MEGVRQVEAVVAQGTPARLISRIGLVAGPILTLVIFLLLPEQYLDAAGKATAFTHAGRATLAMLVWMAVWWMTEAVEIEVTALLPIRASVAPALDVAPQLALIPCAPAASFAFMMPVGTPPNAIVVGTGLVTIPQMCKVGVVLNLAGVILVTAMAYFIILPLIAMR